MLRALGSHVIDLLRFLTLGEITEVNAAMQSTCTHLPGEDGAQVAVTADDYCSAHLVVQPGGRCPAGASWWSDGESSLRRMPTTMVLTMWGAPSFKGPPVCIVGSNGTITLDNNTASMQLWTAGQDGKPQVCGWGVALVSHVVWSQLAEEVEGGGSVFALVGTPALGRAIQAALGQSKDVSALRDAATIRDGLATVYVMDAVMASSAAGGAKIVPKQVV